MSQEERMIEAHKLGRERGVGAFADIVREAMDSFDDREEQIAYVAGFMKELERIGRRGVVDEHLRQ